MGEDWGLEAWKDWKEIVEKIGGERLVSVNVTPDGRGDAILGLREGQSGRGSERGEVDDQDGSRNASGDAQASSDKSDSLSSPRNYPTSRPRRVFVKPEERRMTFASFVKTLLQASGGEEQEKEVMYLSQQDDNLRREFPELLGKEQLPDRGGGGQVSYLFSPCFLSPPLFLRFLLTFLLNERLIRLDFFQILFPLFSFFVLLGTCQRLSPRPASFRLSSRCHQPLDWGCSLHFVPPQGPLREYVCRAKGRKGRKDSSAHRNLLWSILRSLTAKAAIVIKKCQPACGQSHILIRSLPQPVLTPSPLQHFTIFPPSDVSSFLFARGLPQASYAFDSIRSCFHVNLDGREKGCTNDGTVDWVDLEASKAAAARRGGREGGEAGACPASARSASEGRRSLVSTRFVVPRSNSDVSHRCR